MGLSHDYDMLPNEISTRNINESLIIKSPSTQSEKLRVELHKQIENKLNDRQRLSVERAQASARAGCGEGGVRPKVNHEANTRTGPAVTLHSSSTNLQLAEQLTTTDKAGDSCALETCEPERSQNINSEDWQKVVYRKKQNKYRYIGKPGIARDLECTFRAADRKIRMFITNVHVSATEEDITNHIYNKTKEIVNLEKINMKVERGHKTYKFLISEANLSRNKDETLWPEGVIFRRFVNFKYRKTNVAGSTSVNGQNNPIMALKTIPGIVRKVCIKSYDKNKFNVCSGKEAFLKYDAVLRSSIP
ncbi:unnamed protein product [Parnassius apollo]|uniref:(apollo) hypothetical protein n=1 Tax=Parnassius apollo TaxID=110799 RepID=A0A8S3VYL8_PARAO|nr:unnamed protein product [Parnassius apollo]